MWRKMLGMADEDDVRRPDKGKRSGTDLPGWLFWLILFIVMIGLLGLFEALNSDWMPRESQVNR